jgi:EAL domain-containing protein (putative c-di-GMP-specific phosphodiesterase class I)
VKIDGSYVKDIHKNKDNEYFVKTLLELAQNFNLETVAEMVSCSEVHKVLNKYDIDYYQGFHFGFPSIQIPYDEEDGNQSKIA